MRLEMLITLLMFVDEEDAQKSLDVLGLPHVVQGIATLKKCNGNPYSSSRRQPIIVSKRGHLSVSGIVF